MTTANKKPVAAQHDPNKAREPIAGPSTVTAPYPIYLDGAVTKGFGRGSKDLGCPTANLPDEAIEPYADTLETGVHFGYARVSNGVEDEDKVWPMVMSVGWNPFYDNEKRTAEVHVLHDFRNDFYGKRLRCVVLGFVRPEYNYASMDALIDDINTDKRVAAASVVDRPAYRKFEQDPFFR